MQYPILDACCGSKMFYFDKDDKRILFNDIREVDEELSDRRLVIQPGTQYDFRSLPFKSGSFKLVIFDPPHLIKVCRNSWLAKKYGTLPNDWQEYIKAGFEECWRCLDSGGTLVMKWSTCQISAGDVLSAIGHMPILGDKKGDRRWFIFYKD